MPLRIGDSVRSNLESYGASAPDETLALHREVAQLRDQLAKAQQLAHVGLWSFDYRTGKMSWSPEMCLIFGRDPADGAPPIADYYAQIHPDDRDRVLTLLRRTDFSGQTETIPYRILRPDGTLRHVLGIGRVERDDAGRMERMGGTTQDVTDLVSAREQAVESSRVKSQFLANVSHEVRTPVAGILGLTSLAQETRDAAELREYIDAIDNAARGLLAILNDILDLSKIEAGKLVIEHLPFELGRLLRESLGGYRTQALAKGLQFSLHVDPSAPHWLIGDPTRVRQILCNLVDNAVKFTTDGAVEVHVLWRNGLLHLEICDSGIGIAPERREAVFAPFVQADGSTSRRFGGTGLGLAICRELLIKLGGTIHLSGVEPVGSRFEVRIPCPASTAQSRSWLGDVTPRQLPLTRTRQLRVLLAEDNPVNALVLLRWLQKRACEVVHVQDGEAAVQAAAGGGFDLVLMDVQMPVLDGLEATRRIRAEEPPGTRQAVVALTANAMKGDDLNCLQAGMDAYLTKPVDFSALEALLAKVLLTSPFEVPALGEGRT